MAKIGNELNEEFFLTQMSSLGNDMRKHASTRLKNIQRRKIIIKVIEDGRADRSDPTPVDIDPDGDLIVNDEELNKLNTRFNNLKALFLSPDDERPTDDI